MKPVRAMLRSAVAPLLLTALVAPACVTRDESTQITVVLTSETQVPAELDALEVVVTAADGSEVSRILHDVRSPRFFPATLAVIPRNERSLRGPLQVEVLGKLDGKDASVFRRAIVSYVEGRTLLLPMPLRMACFNFRDCGANETCAGGTCRPAAVSAQSLPDYSDAYVFDVAAGGRCFDEAACLAGSMPVAVAKDCTFPLPEAAASDPPRVNVSIRWAAAPKRLIALELGDDVEGWSVAGPRLGKLSPGVCDSLLDPEPDPKKRRVPDKAVEALVSEACPSKGRLQPFCVARDGHVGIGVEIE